MKVQESRRGISTESIQGEYDDGMALLLGLRPHLSQILATLQNARLSSVHGLAVINTLPPFNEINSSTKMLRTQKHTPSIHT